MTCFGDIVARRQFPYECGMNTCRPVIQARHLLFASARHPLSPTTLTAERMSCFLDTYADDDRSDDEMDILGLSRQDGLPEAQIREADRTDFQWSKLKRSTNQSSKPKKRTACVLLKATRAAMRSILLTSPESRQGTRSLGVRRHGGERIPIAWPLAHLANAPVSRPIHTIDKEAPIHLGHPVSFMRSSNARPHFLRQYPIFEQLVPLEGSEEIGDGISCPCSSPDHSLHGSRSNTPVRLQPPTATLDEIEAINYVEDLRSAVPMLAGIALDLYPAGSSTTVRVSSHEQMMGLLWPQHRPLRRTAGHESAFPLSGSQKEVGVWDRVANEWLRYAVAEGPQLAFSPGFVSWRRWWKGSPGGRVTSPASTATGPPSSGGLSHGSLTSLTICCGFPQNFTSSNRVVTSDGNVGGRVVWIDDSFVDPAVTVFGESGYSVSACQNCVGTSSQENLVGVTAGRLKNEQGIVVRKTGPSDNTQRAVSSGGLEIFWLLTTSRQAHRESHSLDNNRASRGRELVEFADGALCASMARRLGNFAHPQQGRRALYRDDVLQRDRERRHARYIGMSVMLVGKHAKKGQYGRHLDTHYDGPSRQEEPRLVLTVRDEASWPNGKPKTPGGTIAGVRRPIWEADYLEPLVQKLGWNWPARGAEAPVAPTDDADPEWAPEPQLLAPPPPPRASASLGEDGGRWLCIPGLVGKRVDVVLMLKMSGRSSGIQIEYAGHSGFIELESQSQRLGSPGPAI
ncbi:hypothetical protein B0H11DRAFT_1929239 [Mycena galericulata]|nr:hypothetical protein B0H11DRAFT_1929239 [Mycena galericulata]